MNSIEEYSKFPCLPNLETLMLSGNMLRDISSIENLQKLSHMTFLTISNNPIARLHNFRKNLLEILPQITFLDNRVVPLIERMKIEQELSFNRKEYNKIMGRKRIVEESYKRTIVTTELYVDIE